MRDNWTRRQVLGRSGAAAAFLAGLGTAGFIGYEWPHPVPAGTRHPVAHHPASSGDGAVDYFVTRKDLHPPVVTVTRDAGAGTAGQPPYIFVAPRGYAAKSTGQSGLMIVDRGGQLVWFGDPVGGTPLNFTLQEYRGEPVLTWSAGYVNEVGVTTGKSYIADSSYRVIATVKAGNGAQTDLHEFRLTPHATALLTGHRKVTADLSPLGGPAKGVVYADVAQEVDVATGKVLFEWDSLDHVKLTESYHPLIGGTVKHPYDFFHMNSIAVAPDGDLIISARNTCTVYKVDRSSGTVRWRLGGKKSDFRFGHGADFYWQHDARMHGPDVLTLFDDGSSPPEEPRSRALVLKVDTRAMRVRLLRAYAHPAGLLADNQGNIQLLPDGGAFVGWGAQPYFSQFAAGGELVLDGEFPAGDQSYRAFTFNWSGHPAGRPAVVAHPNAARGSVVYVSWNGATEVDTWKVLAGQKPAALAEAGTQRRAGFETMISVNSEGPYFAVTAHDRSGRQIGRSVTITRTGA